MCDKLSQVLVSAGIPVLGTATKGASALHLMNRLGDGGGALLCTYALSDMTASELYQIKPDNFEMVVILSARQRAIFRGEGMLCLDIPMNRRDLIETVGMLVERRWGSSPPAEKKNAGPTERSSQQKELIFRAKALLMERNNMTEPDAHRFMQKQSMDTGESLVTVAEKILNGVL